MTPKEYDEFMDQVNIKEKSFKLIASKINHKLLADNNSNSFNSTMSQTDALSKVQGYQSKLNTMKNKNI